MKEKFSKFGEAVKDKWSGFSKVVKVLIISIPIAIIAIVIVLAILFNRKDNAVLFTGLNTDEAGEIAAIITELGVTDCTVNNDGDVIVPEEQVDYLRMQLAMQGYPEDDASYDIWNEGIDLWSTDSDKREVMRQQREARIGAALNSLEAVQSSNVNLDIPEKPDYALIEEDEVPTCAIVLRLKEEAELTNAEVRAIYRLVTTSVEGLINDNISVMDTKGRSYQWISEEEEANAEKDASGVFVAEKRLKFQREYQAALMESLEDMFNKIFGKENYAINVTLTLNYDDMSQRKEEFFPIEGTEHGVANHEQHIEEGGTLDSANGLVGVTPNADASPDYPTYVGLEDGQSYYYNKDEIQYDVTNVVTTIEKDGYSIDKLSVALMINTNSLSQAEREAYADYVAKAAGTEVENVSVFNTVFTLPSGGTTVENNGLGNIIRTQEPDSYRDLLLFVVIALGALLILLLILSLFMSKSRKRKIRRRQERALAAAAAQGVGTGGNAQDQVEPEEVDFNIASLTEEAGKDSRETILKREIAEFSRSSPEIVAQIIKNMLREEI